MRFARSTLRFGSLFFGAAPSIALLVAPNSNCEVQCGNVLSSLSGTDLTCSDAAYKTTVAGQTFQNCLTCELNSTYVDPTTKQSDLQWALYNLRYTVSWCLFGYPNNTGISSSPCVTSFACGEIQNSTEQYLDVDGETTYGYCDQWASDKLPKCQACLAETGDDNYIWNFIQTLDAGCTYQPAPGNQSLDIALQGSVFSETPVNITNPNAPTTLPTWHQSTQRIDLGARIGIAIGGIVFLTMLAGCFIVYRGKRRRRAYLAQHARPMVTTNMPRFHDAGNSSVGSSPQNESAKGLISNQRPWATGSNYEESPVEKTYFSPYSSHFGSPISPNDAGVGGSKDWQPQQMSQMQHNDGIEMSQLSKLERERIDRERWAAQTGFSTDAAPIIRTPQPVRPSGAGTAF